MTTLSKLFLDTWDPFDLLYKDLFNNQSPFSTLSESKINYPVDIYTENDNLVIEVAAAGLEKKDVKIEEFGNVLSVSYEKTPESERDYIQNGIAKRSFKMSWKFSAKYDLSKTEASMEKGILYIKVPKKPEEESMVKHNFIEIK